MRPTLPPKFAVLPVSLVYGDLPRPVALTGMRIWGLGWRYRYERTAPIGVDELCRICGLRRSQLYEHLSTLAATGVLRYTNVGGELTFLLSEAAASPENRTEWAIHDVGDSSGPDSDQQQQILTPHDARESGKPDGAILDALDEIGIAEPTRSEIARLGWVSVDYLADWAYWFADQDRVGVGWLVQQIRAGLEAPIAQARDGRRYIEGEFGAWIQH